MAMAGVCCFMSVPTRCITTIALLATMVSCTDGDHSGGSKPTPRMPVVLDYSPTLSDAGALLYLASNPAVELLAVTLPGTGEADCEPGVRITRSLLTTAGLGDVPVGCGRNTPLIGDRDWPEEWRADVNRWGNELPAIETEPLIDAEVLLADTLRGATAPVTLVAVGPLTNLGVVLGDKPELAEQIERVVIMGGAVTVQGNVEESPAAEWNVYIDPEAARRVIAAGLAVTFVALDATNHVPWTERLVARLGALEPAPARALYELAASRGPLDGFYLWDELAAMAAVEPTLVTIESMTVRVDDDGAVVRDENGFAVDVAVNADANAAMDEFVGTLNGGTVPPAVPLSAAELDYFVQMGGADSDFSVAIGRAFAGIDESDPDVHQTAANLFTGFTTAVEDLLVKLRGISPPPPLSEAHSEYVDALAGFVAIRDDALAAVADAKGTNLEEVLTNALENSLVDDSFERINAACETLTNYSFVRNGPRPCRGPS